MPKKPKKFYCRIRKDLQAENIYIPIGDKYIKPNNRKFEYKVSNGIFMVLFRGGYKKAHSIDFDF